MDKEKDKIPYIVMDRRNTDVHIECESACKDKLQETLIKELQTCMEYHEFKFVDEEKLFQIDAGLDAGLDADVFDDTKLECYECGCQVVLKKYITIVNEVKYCGACKPSVKIDKGLFERFQKFLYRRNETSEIWYFENGEWIIFTVE
jgi:hypothetical protein